MTSRSRQLTFGSLFAGIGGFDLGFERAGMRCLWQVEIDEYCRRVLAEHWPEVPRWDDVRTFPQPGFETPDVICGGFPCQDISYAGQGAGLAGERSGLWYEFARVVRVVGPRIVVVENVAALLTRGMDAVLGTLADLGFDAEWEELPAAAVGAPHQRRRIFIVAHAQYDGRDGTAEQGSPDQGAHDRWVLQPEGRSGTPGAVRERAGTAGTRIVPDANSHRPQRRAGAPLEGGPRVSRETVRSGGSNGGGHTWPPEPGVCRVVDGFPGRVDRIKGLGNAVVPQVAEWIGRRLMEGVQ